MVPENDPVEVGEGAMIEAHIKASGASEGRPGLWINERTANGESSCRFSSDFCRIYETVPEVP